MIKVRDIDGLTVYLFDFHPDSRPDEKFIRQCVTYAQLTLPEKHRGHVTGLVIHECSHERYSMLAEVVMQSGELAEKKFITQCKPFHRDIEKPPCDPRYSKKLSRQKLLTGTQTAGLET